MLIRNATPEDASGIARIHVRTWLAVYAGIVPGEFLAALSEEKRTESWRKRLSEGKTIALVAFEEGTIVGWVSAGPSRDVDRKQEAEIYAIYVSPEDWRRKIGRALMQRIEAELPDRIDVTLWVLRENRGAIGFYEAIGYRHDGTAKEENIGGVTLSEIRLRKSRPKQPSDPTPTSVAAPSSVGHL